MVRKAINPIVRAVTDVMWERDKLQMRAVDALLSAVAPPARSRPKRRRKAALKGRR